jgi:hypothetical protein
LFRLVVALTVIGWMTVISLWIWTAGAKCIVAWSHTGDLSQNETLVLASGGGVLSLWYEQIVIDKAAPPFRPWRMDVSRKRDHGVRRWMSLDFRAHPESTYFANTEVIPGVGPVGHRWSEVDVAAPHWSVAALLAAPSLVWRAARAARRHSRRRKGLCLRCGYDLRASGTGCPECGAEAHGAGCSPPAAA